MEHLQVSSFDRFLRSIARIGQNYIPAIDFASGENSGEDLVQLSEKIIDCRGEAAVLALAQKLEESYNSCAPEQKLAFFTSLAAQFGLNEESIAQLTDVAINDYARFLSVSKSRRKTLFQRISAAPGGIAFLVRMRAELGGFLRENPELRVVDLDAKALFEQWFTRGLLELKHIDWNTSANILAKLQKYEAVHPIEGWDDLHRRLMTDRRCFGFFHPALADEPLIFVQVALSNKYSDNIGQILNQEHILDSVDQATHATFYSISNCQDGLRGISFGSFLIKQVSEQLRSEFPNLRHFATLSPMPSFRHAVLNDMIEVSGDENKQALAMLKEWSGDEPSVNLSADRLSVIAAKYLTQFTNGRLLDPVARFHLGNGAVLDRINVGANMSPDGMQQSFGLMVNYHYDLHGLEQNHEQFHENGNIAMGRAVSKLIKQA